MKHAYLIMAHKNFEQLNTLIALLDDERNDIYVHIDKKAKGFKEELLTCRKSQLIYIKRITTSWGGSSLIKCELELLKEATPKKYSRYHLISGMDLPIKSQDYIHDFFNDNLCEYISYDQCSRENCEDRVEYYYFFQNHIGRQREITARVLRRIQWFCLLLQKKWKFKRQYNVKIYKGAQWFSITECMAQYLVENEKRIKKIFEFSFCADELFVQTFAKLSPYADNIVNNNLRFIDWNRGTPYTFLEKNYEEIIKKEALFARKFDEEIDAKIIQKVVKWINES